MKHLSTLRKKNHRDSPSSGERRGNSLNLDVWRKPNAEGLRDLNVGLWMDSRSIWKDAPKRVKASYAKFPSTLKVSQVPRDTRNPVGIRADHGPRLNITPKPIVHKYREGKLKRTLVKRVK